MKKALYLSSVVFFAAIAGASAADFAAGPYGATNGYLNELRMGVLAHDVDRREKGSVNLQMEALFQPLSYYGGGSKFWGYILSPRPHIGASINSAGDTSYGYAGASWLVPVWGPLFVEASFGGAVHDGKLNNVDPKREPLGTRALFRESASIGFDYDRFRVMVTVEHLSNAGIGKWNHGLTHIGGRVGYKF